jgi:serine/threonine-protein kinase RsbW
MRRTGEPTVNVKFCLVFPHEALSVPVIRRILGDMLRRLGADEDGVADLLLAVTEACTNVIRHGRGGPGRRYEVVASLGEGGCLVQVLNGGRRLDSHVPSFARRHARRASRYPVRPHRWDVRLAVRWRPGRRTAAESQEIAALPESGRGLAIMRACVDDVTLSSGPGRATVVSLQKRMAWRSDPPLVSPSAGELRDAG